MLWIGIECDRLCDMFGCIYIVITFFFSLSSKHFIDGMCVVALGSAAITTMGAIVHPFGKSC